ncbi:CoA transferase [Candidimonas sp. SYP-B2681]|uniref:CaiB/BaiF CoA transferase family protein n=1 Tax=Candidimonas sp. SYP-B2681 TaxID=2497686 RepID=UPI000F884135|nr:CaiB/BaiF CoA-transferase family protein [Candidimonas sp. SYP-B2681]RTZ39143.1 CoA transferase [Candidimonas sp. SYP-B2681]
MDQSRSLPLRGIKVLDLTRIRAGPTATRQFVHWGADVIKIEAPELRVDGVDMGGPRTNSDFQNLNGGKRSLTLDLKHPRGRQLFYELVKTADVVVENFRPDVMDKLEISYSHLKEINARIICASISGFGQDGPYHKRPGFDQIIQGMSGLMSVTGQPGTPFVRTGIAVADSVTGHMCAQGVLLALLERERSGVGQWVQVSLLETLINLMDFQAVRFLNEGEMPVQVGNDHATRMPTGVYRTADGEVTICAAADAMWKKLCMQIGREDLIANPLFSEQAGRSKNRQALNHELESTLLTRDTTYWVNELNKAGVACGPVYTVEQMFSDEQVKHLQVIRQVQHDTLGTRYVLGQPIRLSSAAAVDDRPAPARGEHSKEILKEMGLTDQEVAQLQREQVL